MAGKQSRPSIVVCMQYRNRVVGSAVLKYHQEAAVAEALRVFLVSNSPITQDPGAIGVCEMGALLREHIVSLMQIMGWHELYSGFFLNFVPSRARSGYDD